MSQRIANLCQIDIQILQKVPKETFDTISKVLEFLSNSDFDPLQSIKIHDDIYALSDFDKLTLGEWVDIDSILNNEECETSFSDILGIVCRPIGESYNHETAVEQAKIFRQQSCEKILPLISFFFAQRSKIQRDFEPLFNGSGSSQPVSSGYKNFCSKWGWYKTIADLAADQILLFDQIIGKTVVEVFGFLLYRIDKSHAELDQMKFQQQINKRR